MNAHLKTCLTALAIAALTLCALVGCGQKGDLYLPEPRPQPQQTP
ncbi:MAG TPA: lipoprotein [Gammaproteobacteria bacterium]|nr:lipoprotein [Gammaproteobacteria bacterium]